MTPTTDYNSDPVSLSYDERTVAVDQWIKLGQQMLPSKGAGSGNFQSPGSKQHNDAQWLRRFNITIYKPGAGTTAGDAQAKNTTAAPNQTPGLDLSSLRCHFTVEKSTALTPNMLYARIYNMAPKTMAKVMEFTRVKVQAGYWFSGYGVIFDGTVVQFRRGKENPVDTYLEIHAGDGDAALNGTAVFEKFPAGTKDGELLRTAIDRMQRSQADLKIGTIDAAKLQQMSQKARVDVGSVNTLLRELSKKLDMDIFVENGTIHAIGKDGYLPGQAVELSARTGMVNIPEVTPQGIQVKCLLNPKLRLAGLVKIKTEALSGVAFLPGTRAKTDETSGEITGLGAPFGGPIGIGGTAQEAALLIASRGQNFETAYTSPTGTYRILLMTISGDTRAQPWYCDLVCIALNKEGGPMINPKSAFSRADPRFQTAAAAAVTRSSPVEPLPIPPLPLPIPPLPGEVPGGAPTRYVARMTGG